MTNVGDLEDDRTVNVEVKIVPLLNARILDWKFSPTFLIFTSE